MTRRAVRTVCVVRSTPDTSIPAVLPYRDGRFGDAVLFSRLPGDPAPG